MIPPCRSWWSCCSSVWSSWWRRVPGTGSCCGRSAQSCYVCRAPRRSWRASCRSCMLRPITELWWQRGFRQSCTMKSSAERSWQRGCMQSSTGKRENDRQQKGCKSHYVLSIITTRPPYSQRRLFLIVANKISIFNFLYIYLIIIYNNNLINTNEIFWKNYVSQLFI